MTWMSSTSRAARRPSSLTCRALSSSGRVQNRPGATPRRPRTAKRRPCTTSKSGPQSAISLTSSPARAAEHCAQEYQEGEESEMNGNIDDWLDIVSGDTTVTVTGWIDFQPGDPNNVQVW